jgi:diaminopimelate decarboxylase
MDYRDSLYIDDAGRLIIGGCKAKDLAEEFGTPLYVFDESYTERVAESLNGYLKTGYPDSLVCYASKAFCCKAVYRIMSALGLGVDVASGGELYTANSVNFDADKIYFHGNNKSAEELESAVKAGVHAVVVDNESEIDDLAEISVKQGKTAGVLIRVNPGIEAHTHSFVQTAKTESKFGFAIKDAALAAVEKILSRKSLNFLGVHCHIGSQIFDTGGYILAVDKMTDLIAGIKSSLGTEVKELNLGGGYGVKYTDADNPLPTVKYLEAIAEKLKSCIKTKGISAPRLIVEPGRSLVAEAGITLYTVGAVKRAGEKKFVSVDGGLFENPRYTMYRSAYTPITAAGNAGRMPETVTIAGKCCEADTLIADVRLPEVKKGDILAVLGTGAYNYSMASNYNRNPVPPVVAVKDGKARYIVRPQTYGDIIERDLD